MLARAKWHTLYQHKIVIKKWWLSTVCRCSFHWKTCMLRMHAIRQEPYSSASPNSMSADTGKPAVPNSIQSVVIKPVCSCCCGGCNAVPTAEKLAWDCRDSRAYTSQSAVAPCPLLRCLTQWPAWTLRCAYASRLLTQRSSQMRSCRCV